MARQSYILQQWQGAISPFAKHLLIRQPTWRPLPHEICLNPCIAYIQHPSVNLSQLYPSPSPVHTSLLCTTHCVLVTYLHVCVSCLWARHSCGQKSYWLLFLFSASSIMSGRNTYNIYLLNWAEQIGLRAVNLLFTQLRLEVSLSGVFEV